MSMSERRLVLSFMTTFRVEFSNMSCNIDINKKRNGMVR